MTKTHEITIFKNFDYNVLSRYNEYIISFVVKGDYILFVSLHIAKILRNNLVVQAITET